MTLSTGNFRLVLLVGKSEVPAHTGRISRDSARRLKKAYQVTRPGVQTRVRKVSA
jgi:hypothetical protein